MDYLRPRDPNKNTFSPTFSHIEISPHSSFTILTSLGFFHKITLYHLIICNLQLQVRQAVNKNKIVGTNIISLVLNICVNPGF